MQTGYEEVREELMTWDMDDLLFGLNWELSLWAEETFDKKLISVYLDVIEEKLPSMPRSDKYKSYEGFRKRMFDKYGMELPPIEIDPGQ